MSFLVADTTHIYNAVVTSCKTAGFQMIENQLNFNLLWCHYISANDIRDLNKHQKVNHFPSSNQLGRKDLLWRNLNRLRIKFPSEYCITPMSYLL